MLCVPRQSTLCGRKEVNKETWCLKLLQNPHGLLGTGRMGEGVWRRGKREIIYLSLHYHHQNDCIEMGSDESHFNVSLIARDVVTRQCPQATTFQEKGEPKRIRTKIPLLYSLTPYHQAKPSHCCLLFLFVCSVYNKTTTADWITVRRRNLYRNCTMRIMTDFHGWFK